MARRSISGKDDTAEINPSHKYLQNRLILKPKMEIKNLILLIAQISVSIIVRMLDFLEMALNQVTF